jgi:hypothetical protein
MQKPEGQQNEEEDPPLLEGNSYNSEVVSRFGD